MYIVYIYIYHFTTYMHTNTVAYMPHRMEACLRLFSLSSTPFFFCTSLSYVHITTLSRERPHPFTNLVHCQGK